MGHFLSPWIQPERVCIPLKCTVNVMHRAGFQANQQTLEPQLLSHSSSLLPIFIQPIHTLCIPSLGKEKTTEEPRRSCLGYSMDDYSAFNLKDKAGCFTKCRQSESEPCDVGNLQKYWLNYEAHLVEEGLTEKVNMSFLKALVQNLSTSTTEDLYFSLKPSQVKSSPAPLAGSDPIFLGQYFKTLRDLYPVIGAHQGLFPPHPDWQSCACKMSSKAPPRLKLP
ncbi:hypothetical protein P7K49_036432 [Saguinus oedipus]|uniref:Uncharacterized protein n=1 Tax=Saguinus oedipus TaxID=9490 RepID=A0ABQ9TLR8_SAGOE|nr:hypothetical protein P7K49_036432 [Saguinus oedipus]